ILGGASFASAGLPSVAAFVLLDQYARPPSTASSATAARSPRNFIAYLLFHQTATPDAITISGRNTMLAKKIRWMLCPSFWTLTAWSAGSLGRIEIRSSSALSQFIMFRNRSRLPLNRRKLLAIHAELPTTTKRPLPEYVPAAASTSGPF